MSNTVPGRSPHHRNWYDPFPPWVVISGIVGTTLVAGFFTVLIHWDKVEAHAPRMWAAATRLVSKPEPPSQTAPAPSSAQTAPTPPPRKKAVEVVRPSFPCLDDPAEIKKIIWAIGGDKYERQFNKYLKGRETCFVLPLSEVRTSEQVIFAAPTWKLNPDPTYIVQLKSIVDVKKYTLGTRLRITGELARYVDKDGGEPDEIYITKARVTEEDGATGSIRK